MIRIKEIKVKRWLVNLKDTIFSRFCLKQVLVGHDIASRLKDLNKSLEVIEKEFDDITNQKDKFKFLEEERIRRSKPPRIETTPFVTELDVFGRVKDKAALVTQLLDEGRTQDNVVVMSIVGTSGLGKTTLAQLVYNDEDVDAKFQRKIWVCVSDRFDVTQIAKAILRGLGKAKEAHDLNELDPLLKLVSAETTGKKFLLVLDDVWNENDELWEPLRNSLQKGGRGSKVLVTTRNENVAIMMRSEYVHPLGSLSDDDCWSLFQRIAFFGRMKDVDKLEDIGRAIVNKCEGMPLAVKTLARLMRLKHTREEWKNVLDSESWKLMLPPTLGQVRLFYAFG